MKLSHVLERPPARVALKTGPTRLRRAGIALALVLCIGGSPWTTSAAPRPTTVMPGVSTHSTTSGNSGARADASKGTERAGEDEQSWLLLGVGTAAALMLLARRRFLR